MARFDRHSESKHRYKKVPEKIPQKKKKKENFHLDFMADKGHKGQNLVLVT